MKNILLVVACLLALPAFSEPSTNCVVAAPNFREVDGQLYNVEKSNLFHQFHGVCEGVSTNGSIMVTPRLLLDDDIHYAITGQGFHWQGQTIVVKNYPTNDVPATGLEVSGFAKKVGTIRLRMGLLELWDYGTPHCVLWVTNK